MDVAKAMAIILMAACHVGMYFAPPDSRFYCAAALLGDECCAPVFMFCIGLSFCCSRSSTAEQMMRRGAITFLKGCLLNVIRGFLPVKAVLHTVLPIWLIIVLMFVILVVSYYIALAWKNWKKARAKAAAK